MNSPLLPDEPAALSLGYFMLLAVTRPEKLIKLLNGDGVVKLSAAELSFATEAAARIENSAFAVPPLLKLARHESPIVREGVVYGLESHSNHPAVRPALARLAKEDTSPGVRTAAAEALELL